MLRPRVVHAQNRNKPNVIFILADDLGWGDLNIYGNKRFKTPQLDQLAREGRFFTQFYVNAPVCSPSRAGFLTGHFPSEYGIHGYFSLHKKNKRRGMPDYLDPKAPTITRILQQHGYVTGHFGKWHLGQSKDSPLPSAYGIDDSRTCSSNDTTANFKLWYPENRPKSTKMVLDATLSFIEKNKNKPFYVNAWLVDPHAVLNPSKKQMEPFKWASPSNYTKKYYGEKVRFHGSTQVYYATVAEMDRQIGIFLKKLKRLNLSDNTIIIFSSDNGPEDKLIANASHSAAGSTGPFRGRKRSLYEGGIRMPLIIRWSGRIPRGTIDSTSIISGIDFLPTLAHLCGIHDYDIPQMDGEDMSQSWLGNAQRRTKPLMWERRYKIYGSPLNKSPMLAIREGKWKLLMNPNRSRLELYDVPNDPSELNNLSQKHPTIVTKLAKQVLKWHNKLPKGPIDKTMETDVKQYPLAW